MVQGNTSADCYNTAGAIPQREGQKAARGRPVVTSPRAVGVKALAASRLSAGWLLSAVFIRQDVIPLGTPVHANGGLFMGLLLLRQRRAVNRS